MTPSEFLDPVGWIRPVGSGVDDDEIRRVLVAFIGRPGGVPLDAAPVVEQRLAAGEPPRAVAEWLLAECEQADLEISPWLRELLAED